MSSRFISWLALLAAPLAGCVYYPATPVTYVAPASAFDRSWEAARGALLDQGVRILRDDRVAGILRGARDGIEISADVRTQADGRVRVEFHTHGQVERDPELINRVTRDYQRRMGR